MDFFLPQSVPQAPAIKRSKVSYFAIYDPLLLNRDDDDEQEQQADHDHSPTITTQLINNKGILVLLPQVPERNTTKSDSDDHLQLQIRRIGMIQGMSEFVQSYTSNGIDEPLEFVELDNQSILFEVFEGRYNVIMSIDLGGKKREYTDNGKRNGNESDETVAPLGYLRCVIRQGYEDFRLHNGSIESLCGSMAVDEVSMFLTKWWSVWIDQMSLKLEEDGALKKFHSGVIKSQLNVANEITSTCDELQAKHGFKECFIWNVDQNDYGDYGLFYEHKHNCEIGSKLRLLKWLQESDHYGLSPQSLSQPVIMKRKQSNDNNDDDENDTSTGEQVYDPFKLVWSTLGDVSNATGITSGVDAGFKTISEGVTILGDGVKAVNKYVPWWGHHHVHANDGASSSGDGDDHNGDEVITNTTGSQFSTNGKPEPLRDVQFLIGKMDDGNITFKNVYLSFDQGETLHRLVIWKSFQFVVVLVYEFKVNTLNEVDYYDVLEDDLKRLSKRHFPDVKSMNGGGEKTKRKSFYYIGFDKKMQVLESNIPFIVHDHNDGEDSQRIRDQWLLVHKELFNNLEVVNKDKELEKLSRTSNGWWCYQLKDVDDKYEVIILKRWRKNQALMESCVDIEEIIGVDGKAWLEDYLERR